MHITYSVFYSGTSHEVGHTSTLVHLLEKHIDKNTSQKTIAFDGCAVTHGVSGAIFGTGLDEQCQVVIEQIEAEIKKGNTVSLNVYGHSRGAIAALLLAKQLGNVDANWLEINLALLDPVPGNLITPSVLEVLDITLANKTMDLRSCTPLKNVLTLYPNEPLSAFDFHAPLFSLYPEHTNVEEEVIAGCHAGAQFQNYYGNEVRFKLESFITFARTFQFLKKCGCQFKPLPTLTVGMEEIVTVTTDKLEDVLLEVYCAKNQAYHEKTYRDCHSADGVYINTKDKAEFFNLHHQRLSGVVEDKNNARVTIEKSNDPISLFQRATLNYPKTWQAIKWLSISAGLACLIYFTGGLGAIPVIAGLVAKFGLLSLLVLTPLAGGSCAGLWYGVIKPLLQWTINRIYYPCFHIRDIQPPSAQPITESSHLLISTLGVNTNNTHQPKLITGPDDQLGHSSDIFKEGGVLPVNNRETIALEFR